MKIIAISQRVQIISDINERRDAVSQEWCILVEKCGFLPILLPNNINIVKQIFNNINIDGILLTGGNDLVNYGGDAPERDEVEKFLINYSVNNKLPLLGVCRGMQIIADYFGQTLYKVKNHIAVEHILNNKDKVNSFHSWGLIECNGPIIDLCRSNDGVIESITHLNYNWIKGIMWHPERYSPLRKNDIRLFKEVFDI